VRTPKHTRYRAVSINVAACLRLAAAIRCAMSGCLILGGLLLTGSLPVRDPQWGVGLIMGPTMAVSIGLIRIACQEMTATGDQR
jgi:hypothetical protein